MIFNVFSTNLDVTQKILLFVALLTALLAALTLHEFAHAYVALLNGDRTAKMNGRVSLNPMRHIDPIGFVMLMVVGFGYAKPVPVNPLNFKKRRLGLFTVSIAGVAVNLTLAIITSGIFMAVLVFSSLSVNSFLMQFLWYFQSINLALCFFNLLPFFPLDGFNVLASFCRPGNRFIVFMRKYGLYIFFVIIGLSLIVQRFDPGRETVIRYFDLLGTYFRYTADMVLKGLLWLWGRIFGIPLG
ncbi:MAG: site-2 protease family protein [Firmicutes bacterium]|nr:site-2 protease family protein [Bacillota bacterium]